MKLKSNSCGAGNIDIRAKDISDCDVLIEVKTGGINSARMGIGQLLEYGATFNEDVRLFLVVAGDTVRETIVRACQMVDIELFLLSDDVFLNLNKKIRAVTKSRRGKIIMPIKHLTINRSEDIALSTILEMTKDGEVCQKLIVEKLSNYFGVSKRSVYRYINHLVDLGKVKKRGYRNAMIRCCGIR